MTKNRKKVKKIQENVLPASAQQPPEPENVSMSSGPVNSSMSDGESGRFHDAASGVNKNKENIATLSLTLSKTTDELNKKPGPPESNPEDLSQLTNKCRALKAELNATKKKYEDEKQLTEKLYEENQELKSKLSSLERELQDIKMQIQRFEKESAHHQKSSEECERMECEPTKGDSWEEQEPKTSVDCTRERKEDNWVENNIQGTREKSWSNEEPDTEMTESSNREQSGLSKRSDRYKDDNFYKADGKQLDVAAPPWPVNTEAGSSRQPSKSNYLPVAPGIETRGQKSGGSNMGWQRNEWRRHQPPRNEEHPHGPRNRGRGRAYDNRGDQGQNCRRGRGNRGDTGQNYNHNVNYHDRYDHRDRTTDEPQVVTEIVSNRCDAPTEDVRMGSGIAVTSSEWKEDGWVENNAQDEKQLDVAASPWYADTEAGNSSQPTNISYVPAASGSDTRWRHTEWGQTPHVNADQPPPRNKEQHHGARNQGRERGLDNRGDQGQNYRRGWEGRGDHGQNYNHNENNRDRYDHRVRTTDESPVVTEIFGDLFDAPTDCSLAHCVAEDMRMGSGIAVTFRQKFKRVDELLDQRKRQGNVAVLEDEGRYIYYLVTKRESNGKPTMLTLEKSLIAMCEHVVQNQVKKIAMPRIGCGLDRLDWHKVKPLIQDIFSEAGAQITIYNYNEGHGKHKSKERSKSGSIERNQNPNYKKSEKKKGKNKKFGKKPGKNSKKGEKKLRN